MPPSTTHAKAPSAPPPVRSAAGTAATPAPAYRAQLNPATETQPTAATGTDIAARMALLMEAQREEHASRRKRARRNFMILFTAVMVPASLYVLVTLVRVLSQ